MNHYIVGTQIKVSKKFIAYNAPSISNEKIHEDLKLSVGFVCAGCAHKKVDPILLKENEVGCCGCGEHRMEWLSEYATSFSFDYLQGEDQRIIVLYAKESLSVMQSKDGDVLCEMGPDETCEFVLHDGAEMWVKSNEGVFVIWR